LDDLQLLYACGPDLLAKPGAPGIALDITVCKRSLFERPSERLHFVASSAFDLDACQTRRAAAGLEVELACRRVLLGTIDPSTEWEVLDVTFLAYRHDADGDRPSLTSAARTGGVVAAGLVAIQRRFRHAETSWTVVPLWEAHVGHANARLPLGFRKFRRADEILDSKPLLKALFAKPQIVRRSTAC
jgi:hypothetical protein